jgi:hypothetical protein
MRRCYQSGSNHTRLFRNRKKVEPWQSDFLGRILLQDGVRYFVGVTVRTTLAGEEYLSIYLRPDMQTLGRRRAKFAQRYLLSIAYWRQWRLLPRKVLPPLGTVYHYFRP